MHVHSYNYFIVEVCRDGSAKKCTHVLVPCINCIWDPRGPGTAHVRRANLPPSMRIAFHYFSNRSLTHSARATEVQKFVGFTIKRLRCGDPALPPLNSRMVGHFSAENAHAHYSKGQTWWRRGFCSLVHSLGMCVCRVSHQ